jgi:hypothetical protein
MKELKTCPFCDGPICHDSDALAAEMYDGYEEGDDALVSFYRCTRCGREIEVTEPSEKERETDYKEYWQ